MNVLNAILLVLCLSLMVQAVHLEIVLRRHAKEKRADRAQSVSDKAQIQLLHHPGNEHIGWRTMGHKDIKEALETPGLKIRLPNGVEELGIQ